MLAMPGGGAPVDYAVPPPPLALADLHLPAVATNTPDLEATGQPTARSVRDHAIRAFQAQHYAEALAGLDQLETVATLAPNLRLLRAWAATYASDDQRGATLWSQCAAEEGTNADAFARAAWHHLRLNQGVPGTALANQALALEPSRARTLLLAGLAAWTEGRHTTAQHLLVQAMRAESAPPEAVIAMAALQADLGHYPECAGWLRRILPSVSSAQRIRWLSLPEFAAVKQDWAEGWQDLVRELGLSVDEVLSRNDPASRATTPVSPVTPDIPAPASGLLLRLSPFSEQPRLRMEQVRLHQQDLIMRRLKANEQLPDETMTTEYEVLGAPRN